MSKAPEEAEVSKAPEGETLKYTYDQLLQAKSGMDRDIWACALKPGMKYTIPQAEAAVAAYLKKEVKS